jgi:hypothetical protein
MLFVGGTTAVSVPFGGGVVPFGAVAVWLVLDPVDSVLLAVAEPEAAPVVVALVLGEPVVTAPWVGCAPLSMLVGLEPPGVVALTASAPSSVDSGEPHAVKKSAPQTTAHVTFDLLIAIFL